MSKSVGASEFFLFHVFRRTFDYTGRTTRIQFWLWTLLVTWPIIYLLFWGPWQPVSKFLDLVFIIPSLSLMVRRLRDSGLSPFWILPLLVVVPYSAIAAAMTSNGNPGTQLELLAILLVVTLTYLGIWMKPTSKK